MATNKIYIPTFIGSVNYTPARVLPHIYFYNGKKSCEEYYIQGYFNGNTGSVVSQPLDSFPYFDNYEGQDPQSGSRSLLFFNEPAVYGTTPTGSLYSDYWETYVSLLYNPRTRLVNCEAIIPLADYFKMELNDIVEWRGNYYHLRAINDYNLSNGECKLQLLGPLFPPVISNLLPELECGFAFTSSLILTTTTTSGPTTTTTTLAPTTTSTTSTTSTTTSGPTTTTTTCAPCIQYTIQRNLAGTATVQYIDCYGAPREDSFASSVARDICAREITTLIRANATVRGNCATVECGNTSSLNLCRCDNLTVDINGVNTRNIYWLDCGTGTPETYQLSYFGITRNSDCRVSGSLILPTNNGNPFTFPFTPTPCNCSTTTTTTGAPVEYQIDNGASGDSATACSGATTTSLVYTQPANTVPFVGMILYNSTSLTTPFIGSAGWRKLTGPLGTYAVEIDVNGEITNYVTC